MECFWYTRNKADENNLARNQLVISVSCDLCVCISHLPSDDKRRFVMQLKMFVVVVFFTWNVRALVGHSYRRGLSTQFAVAKNLC